MSIPIRPDSINGPRDGFSILEILVVLVIMGLATAAIMPSLSRMLDQATAHAVFFEFQRDISQIRREANRTGVNLTIVDPVVAPSAGRPQIRPEDGSVSEVRTIPLRAPWRYTMAPSLDVAEGGVCSPTSVNLIRDNIVVMTLQTTGTDCKFSRLQRAVVPPRAPSSQR